MDTYCVNRKYIGPVCYEVTKDERRKLDMSTFWSTIFIILFIIFLIWVFTTKDSKKPNSKALVLIGLPLIMSILIVGWGQWVLTVSKCQTPIQTS